LTDTTADGRTDTMSGCGPPESPLNVSTGGHQWPALSPEFWSQVQQGYANRICTSLPIAKPSGHSAHGRTAMQLMASRIKTYTEQIERSETLAEIRDMVSDAHTIVFLGFSYHPANMKLLSLEHASDVEQIFGTAKGVSESDTAFILKKIGASFRKNKARKPPPVVIRDMTCAESLGEYSRALFVAGATHQ
jgi:hypothetical protein